MLNILIIEDNIKLRQRIKSILLSRLSFLNVAEAAGENETFAEIQKKKPDLVIMDIQLGAENGLNLTKKIKMSYPFIPVAINTNNDTLEYKTATVRIGADYFLSKKTNTIDDLALLAASIFLRKSEDTSKSCKTGKNSDTAFFES